MAETQKRRLITLAANPLNLGEESETDDWQDELDEVTDKGRKVTGPRTKLASEAPAASASDVKQLAKAIGILVKNQNQIAEVINRSARVRKGPMDGGDAFSGYDVDDDPMAVEEPDAMPEDSLSLSGDGFSEDSGGDPNNGNEIRNVERTADDQKESAFFAKSADIRKAYAIVRAHQARLRKSSNSKVSKDDAASSFGETDDDLTGNRPYDPTRRGGNDSLINGDESDGPGPSSLNKAELAKVIATVVSEQVSKAVSPVYESLNRVGIQADAPGIGGGSQISKSASVDLAGLQDKVTNMSFAQINKMREDIGDLGKSF